MTTPGDGTIGIEHAAVSGKEESRCIYWHRDLPPVDAEMLGEHVLEAHSSRMRASFAYRDEAWESCHRDLMEQTKTRLKQEIDRLGGDCAHIVEESVVSRRDDATGGAWLEGRFTYMLYRRTAGPTIDGSGAP